MMSAFRPRTVILFLGDILFFYVALWLSLFLRAFEAPSLSVFGAHVVPFSYLFVVWVGVFFIAGLYEGRLIMFARRDLSNTLLISQTINVAIAAIFFFLTASFGIAPKTVLAIYLAVSFVCVLLWRVALYPRLGLHKPEPAIMLGEGTELEELRTAFANAPRAPMRVVATVNPEGDLATTVADAVEAHGARAVIGDFSDQRVADAFADLYNLLFRGVRFYDSATMYEDMFGRVPLSHVNEQWIARHISPSAHVLYDPLKRAMDIVLALLGGAFSLVAYPFLALAIKLQDGGPIFYSQIRTGENNKPIRMSKFRSMSGVDSGKEVLKSNLVVTPLGHFLRQTRIDEIPQLWSVVKGDMSLIGPRPEFPALVEEYAKQIPYYNLRHIVKPGLSGWAQLYGEHAHHGADVEVTRNKLSYDLYYLKHRSLMLDAVIALKTLKKLITRSGV